MIQTTAVVETDIGVDDPNEDEFDTTADILTNELAADLTLSTSGLDINNLDTDTETARTESAMSETSEVTLMAEEESSVTVVASDDDRTYSALSDRTLQNNSINSSEESLL